MVETSVTLLDSQTVTSWRGWAADPREGAFYAEDGIDFSNGLGITAGLRFGMYDPRFDFTEEPMPTMPGADTGGPLPGGSLCTAAPAKKWLDPSISIVQQIAGHCRITLEYARRSRMPRTVFMYSNADSILAGENPFVGNPDLDPEHTVDIRLGFDRSCPGRGEMGVSLFYREMDDLVTTETRQDPGQGDYRQFANGATAEVQGLEVSQRAGYSDWLAWSVSYTLSRAEGSWSVLQEDQEYEWTTPWISDADEFPLDWDRRHSLETSVSGEFPARAGIAGGLGAGLTWTYASGFPLDTSYYGEAPDTRNAERYPAATRTDASIWRNQTIGGLDLTLRFDVVNLFQEKNIAWIVDPSWYLAESESGGPFLSPTGLMNNNHAYASPRHFLLGLSVGW
jgi:outer membrane receptor protein involved in Fe transport